jgi:hypothetical protein
VADFCCENMNISCLKCLKKPVGVSTKELHSRLEINKNVPMLAQMPTCHVANS